MTIRFLADEDLKSGIVAGLRFREPAIDILDVKSSGRRGMKDPALLEPAFQADRILITHDRNTMLWHYQERLVTGKWNSPGLFVVPQRCAVGEIVESLLLLWVASGAEEWRDQILFLPYR